MRSSRWYTACTSRKTNSHSASYAAHARNGLKFRKPGWRVFRLRTRRPELEPCLEIQLHTKLQDARIPNRGDRAKIARREAVAYVVELGMVEGIECFHTELETATPLFIKQEALEERDVPVVPARLAYLPGREGAPFSDRRRGKCRRAEPLANGLWIAEASAEVWPVCCIR